MPSQTWKFRFSKSATPSEKRRVFVSISPEILFFKLERKDDDDHFDTVGILTDRGGIPNREVPIERDQPPVFVSGFALTIVAKYLGERPPDHPIIPGERLGDVAAVWDTVTFPEALANGG
jgi:hypothetical protein